MRKPTTKAFNSPAARKTVLGRHPFLRGFTLIEFLVVFAIVAVVASLLLPALSPSGRFGGPIIGIPGYAARAMIVGSNSRRTVLGTLPLRALVEIRLLIGREKWRGVMPHLSWSDISVLPGAIRSRLSEPTSGIIAKADGTVEVVTRVKEWEVLARHWTYWREHTYVLKKGQKGWQIIGVWQWEHCRG